MPTRETVLFGWTTRPEMTSSNQDAMTPSDTVRPVLLLGLTGGIGSGKSTVSGLLARRGAVVIDADQVTREVQAPGGAAYQGIVDRFGAGILAVDGTIDRPALAKTAKIACSGAPSHASASVCRSSPASSWAEPMRSLGSFSRQRAISRSTLPLTFTPPCVSGGGGFWRIRSDVDRSFGPSNGRVPLMSS